MLSGVNWGQAGAWAGAFLSLGSAFGYALAKDYRRALYFFFAFCITCVVIYR
jgi:nitrate/nitrite transporter NarK